MMKTNHKRVVILGGGFAGIRAALDLDRLLPRGHEIVLVDRRMYHSPQPMLYEVATACLRRERKVDFSHLRGSAIIPYHDMFSGTRVRVNVGAVTSISLEERMVYWGDEGAIRYDALVLALGSETNYFGIPGLADRAYALKDADDALNLRNAVEELFASAIPGKKIDLAVGGGGYSGVEFAGELAGCLRHFAKKYRIPLARVSLAIIEAGPMVLASARPAVQKLVLARLSRLGVRTALNAPIEKYEGNTVFLKGGGTHPARLLVWTAGIAPNRLLARIEGLPLQKGYAAVNDFLQVPAHPEVFAVGDNVSCFDAARKCPVAATAQRALDQGRLVAENISAYFSGGTLAPFVPRQPFFVIPVGGKFAVADLKVVSISGILAWFLKLAIEFKYLASILPLHEAVSLWIEGVRLYEGND